MPQFTYKARSLDGQLKGGILLAENQAVVIRKLKADGLFPVTIEETQVPSPHKLHKKTKPSEITIITRQLANLVRSGFPLTLALTSLSAQNQSQALKKILDDLQDSVQKGSNFSDALGKYPALFPSFYTNMIKIGETSGRLAENLERLAECREREEALFTQFKSALAYPLFLFLMGLATIFILVTFFIPRLSAMFYDLEQTIPLPTRIIMATSRFLSKSWWICAAIIYFSAIKAKSFYRLERNKLFIDRLLLNTLFIKEVLLKIEVARFSYALGVLLKNGVPIIGALGVVALNLDNRLLREKIASFQKKISKGQSLSSCFRAEKIFPLLLTNMIAIGEASGELPEMLFRVSSSFEEEVTQGLKTVVSLLGPVLILFIGGIVLFIVVAILLPVFQLNFLSAG